MKIVDVLLLGGIFLISNVHNIGSLETPTRGCAWRRNKNTESPTLVCQMRNINGASGFFGNLSNTLVNEVKDLSLECSETLSKKKYENNSTVVNSTASWDFLSVFPELRRLSIDLCRIENLSEGIFDTAPKLRQLFLERSHNRGWFSTSMNLDYNALQGLTELRELHLGHNNISSLPEEFFCPSCKIEILNLTDNIIQDVKSIKFANSMMACTSKLKILDLSSNGLSDLPDNSLAGLGSLEVLMLQDNVLDKIGDYAFNGLVNLRRLNMSGNRLKALPSKLFFKTQELSEIDLSNNFLGILLPGLFDGLDVLKFLYLSHNNLTSHYIHKDNFSWLENLKLLDLSFNSLSGIHVDMFKNLTSLEYLNLEHNEIDTLSEKCFASLTSLSDLSLAYNKIVRIDTAAGVRFAFRTKSRGIFRNLFQLKNLNISNNMLLWFNYSDLPTNLHSLDMHSNLISELENIFPSDSNRLRIKVMDLSFNRIKEISNASIPSRLLELRLNNNRIQKIAAGTFVNTKLTKVILSSNEISQLELAAIELDPNGTGKVLPKFYIAGNPLLCDCKMEWIQTMNKSTGVYHLPPLADFDSVTCNIVYTRISPKRLLQSLKPQDFVCNYQTHFFPDCDCNITCPENCSCYHDRSWSRNVVDCSNLGHRSIPKQISMIATEIYLDGNELGDLGNNQFISKHKLEMLFLNNSGITNLQDRTFNGAESLRVLHLEFNILRELRGFEFDQLENIRELYLDHNVISTVSSTTFRKMKHLEVLRLNNNRIVDFKPWEMFKNQKTIISLEGNFWNCNCDNAIKFRKWLPEHQNNVAKRMFCMDKIESLAHAIQFCNKLNPEYFETTETGNYLALSFIEGNLVYVIVGVLVIVIVIGVSITSRLKQRFCYHKISSPLEEERDRLYHGYLIYSEHDSDFVSCYLAAELEQFGLVLCLHWRDLPSARPQESVPPAAAAARRVVFIFSPLFIKNEWQHPEFRAALLTTLEAIEPASRRKRIIIILAINTSVHDTELQLLLQICTVIVWGKNNFWEKLSLAMFDSAESSNLEKHKFGTSTRLPRRYSDWPLLGSDNTYSASHSCGSSTSGIQSGRSSSVFTTSTPTTTQLTCMTSTSRMTQIEDGACEKQHHVHSALYSGGSFGSPKSVGSNSSNTHLYCTIPEFQ